MFAVDQILFRQVTVMLAYFVLEMLNLQNTCGCGTQLLHCNVEVLADDIIQFVCVQLWHH